MMGAADVGDGDMTDWRKLALAALSTLALAVPLRASDFPQRYPQNYISYQAGGLMTRSVKMLIDLDKGVGWLAEAPEKERGNQLAETKEINLNSTTLKGFNDLASEVAKDGMETRQCVEAEARARRRYERAMLGNAQGAHNPPPPVFIPQMDAIVFYSVRKGGKSASRPTEYGCQTEASDRLYTLMNKSLHTSF